MADQTGAGATAALPLRLAMWSGPRNISTALLRAWGSRRDTYPCDEPLYAHYLSHVDRPHPMRARVIASQDTDWRRVTAWLTGPVPEGRSIFYQKHMAHHLLPNIGRDWLEQLTHAFLIRDPGEMLPSLACHLPDPLLEDTGLSQQVELFDRVADRLGRAPPVLDARDVLEDPASQLAALCTAVGVDFDPAMLSWAPGPRPTDGVWAACWYQGVWKSTGFAPARSGQESVPPALLRLLERCQPLYARPAPAPDSVLTSGTPCSSASTPAMPISSSTSAASSPIAIRHGSARSTAPCRAATPSGKDCACTMGGSSG